MMRAPPDLTPQIFFIRKEKLEMPNGYSHTLTMTPMDDPRIPSPLTERLPSCRRSNAARLLSETTNENHAILSPSPPYRKKPPISPPFDDASYHIPLRELFHLPPSFGRRLRMDLENVDPHLPPHPRRRRKKRSLVANTNQITEMECMLPLNIRAHRSTGMRVEDGKKVEPGAPEGTPLSPSGEGIFWGSHQLTKSSSLGFGFGFGLLSILSYSTKYLDFNIISAISHVCLLVLAMAFFYVTIFQKEKCLIHNRFQLKQEDLLNFTRLVLPTANTAIAMAQDIFSGQPSTTLKVVPVLLFTANYGRYIALWTLFAIGFFISIALPKLYSCYSQQIQRLAINMNSYVCEKWNDCQHKKTATFFGVTMFWNMFGAKERFIAAFIAIVVIQYYRQFRQEDNNVVEESVQEET